MGRLGALFDRMERILPLVEDLLQTLTGAGPGASAFEENTAFRWDSARGPGRLIAIPNPARFDLDDLQGVDDPLQRLLANTEQFLQRLPCNHVLLYGERGTGKSSAVKGILTRYASRGLRLVEVRREDLAHLPSVLGALRAGGSAYRFVVFCDDLSFGANETGFRELKAALEGSLEAPPDNVCIVATSNRRHLLPETMADNRAARLDDRNELHLGEALEEKLALSDRFGLVLGFFGFSQDTYLAIVERYLEQTGLPLGLADVREDALRWALQRSSRSGRIARHFVDDLAGRHGLERSRPRA
jgi:predicted AAA+ superfamily ATPase